ncbi:MULTISPECIES: type II toxin-antitoxin system PemK/MazF family toxin [unclassified Actinomyces]|uniref:type II toxin-antitoxin system PemK/MazF family toxin n=1 Tax=unclassified Actinomyces TaxID=2609248 RepID=UPI002016D579|nr:MULTISPECIES: type II toxin-antitoxin system PemK/MazF family toxin [unclassified Actinomyces]MCL3776597.1 type II toxin-antitoxin system PemK/MazF family toxin [Actinomyces sp. AC-20-1]MCL3788883.1 type II toxin-antitoxin system PemK/MazF family toxin [Actinomyces sp. 187325]MCL3791011.1 type II toxin-antitoxin system PemK/MazF family toxin [Actinomyces sp. 186855]MCL3793463.1 type II toxin-antitoxin system PemK/MazF family toxin [Actinomyces sp. 217892]
MASLLNRVLGVLGRTARDVATEVVKEELRTRTGSAPASSRRSRASSGRATPATTGGAGSGTAGAGAHRGVSTYDVACRGLPAFSYSPNPDGDADPGEVVWTWVPYEEDATRGKDRPVLVLARDGGRLVVAQLTSKDHDRDREQEARHGRYWFDVGTGAWDPRGRPSKMRLDRLLLVDPAVVRREGSTISRAVFERATRALRGHWG